MNNRLLHLHLFFILLLMNTAYISAMLVPFTMLLPHEKLSENRYYIPIFLQQRLNALPLLLERPPFDFLQLLPELQTRTASLVTPSSMSNLSITCKSLHEKLTFQTPGIWNIVTHSIDAISYKKLPELLVKTHLCAEASTEESQKLFYLSIKEKILSCYDLKASKPYQFPTRNGFWFSFDPFSPNYSNQLIGACYTGDKNILHTIHEKNKCSFRGDIDDLFYVTIHSEKINIIPLLCEWYAMHLETLLQQCVSYTTYDNSAHTLNWDHFIANIAISNNKKTSFKSLIIYYQQYLNIVDKNGMKYLDHILYQFGKKDINFIDTKKHQEYAQIVIEYGGTGNEETMKMLMQ